MTISHVRRLSYRRWAARRAAIFLENHLDREHTEKTVAAKVGVSVKVLILGFREVYGITPMMHLVQLRIFYAKKSFARGQRATYVAFDIGYKSYSGFHKFWTTHMRESPSITRKRCLQHMRSRDRDD